MNLLMSKALNGKLAHRFSLCILDCIETIAFHICLGTIHLPVVQRRKYLLYFPSDINFRPMDSMTNRAFPIWQDGLPFSRSEINRIPTPHDSATSVCVNPSDLRWFLITSPNVLLSIILPFGNINTNKANNQSFFPVREDSIRSDYTPLILFTIGNKKHEPRWNNGTSYPNTSN